MIWCKPTATPESARDRPTRDHETIFLFTKETHYFYDSFAVMEPCTGNSHSTAGVNALNDAIEALRHLE